MARLEEKFRERAQGKRAPDSGPAVAPALDPLAGREVLTELPLSQIEPDPDQPRRDVGDLTHLAESIAAVGLVQPIIVTVAGYERYRILAGERRFAAAKVLGLPKIPAVVRTVDEHQRLELQLVENLHRKDLSPFEEATGYRRLLEEFGLTQAELGKRLGKSQESVSEMLRLLALPAEVQEGYRTSDTVSRSVLLEIAKRPKEEQFALWEEARQGQLTVKKARARRGSATTGATSTPFPALSFRYPVQTELALVTLTFPERMSVTQEEIVAALEEALQVERARLPGGGSGGEE